MKKLRGNLKVQMELRKEEIEKMVKENTRTHHRNMLLYHQTQRETKTTIRTKMA